MEELKEKQCVSCNESFCYDKQRDITITTEGYMTQCPRCGHLNDVFVPKFRKNQFVRYSEMEGGSIWQCESDSRFDIGYRMEVVKFKGIAGYFDASKFVVVPQSKVTAPKSPKGT